MVDEPRAPLKGLPEKHLGCRDTHEVVGDMSKTFGAPSPPEAKA